MGGGTGVSEHALCQGNSVFYLLLLQLGSLGCGIAKYETRQDAKIPFLLNPSNETNLISQKAFGLEQTLLKIVMLKLKS